MAPIHSPDLKSDHSGPCQPEPAKLSTASMPLHLLLSPLDIRPSDLCVVGSFLAFIFQLKVSYSSQVSVPIPAIVLYQIRLLDYFIFCVAFFTS